VQICPWSRNVCQARARSVFGKQRWQRRRTSFGHCWTG